MGIVLSAFGRKGYIYAAFNLLCSIKFHNPELKVSLAFDRDLLTYLTPEKIQLFDHLIEIPKEQFTTLGKIDPAKYKTALYDYLPYEENLILDVDGVCLQNLQSLMTILSAKEGQVYTDVMGRGKVNEEINYMLWASTSFICEHFKIPLERDLVSVQTSFLWVKKGKESKKFFDKLKKNYEKGIDKSKVRMWGGTIPDELFYTGTFGQLDLNPDPEMKPVFFGNFFYPKTYEELHTEFYIMSLYGNGTGRTETKLRYLEYYDKIMKGYCGKFGFSHDYKRGYIMQDKHVNFG